MMSQIQLAEQAQPGTERDRQTRDHACRSPSDLSGHNRGSDRDDSLSNPLSPD